MTQELIAGALVTYDEYPKHTATTSTNGSFELPAVKKWQLRAPFFDHINYATLVVTAPKYSPYKERVEAWNGRKETRLIGLKTAQPGVQEGLRKSAQPLSSITLEVTHASQHFAFRSLLTLLQRVGQPNHV